MSRPLRKARGTIKTKLIICEGISDKKFIDRIKGIIHKRDCGFSVKIDQASGGGPKSAIIHTITYAGSFDKKCVFIDSDIPIPVDAVRAAKNHNLIIIQSIPHCLEGLLLKMTGYAGEIIDTNFAKETFYKQYELQNAVTQKWYDENINDALLEKIIEDDKHCCNKVISDLKNFFCQWP